MHTSFCLSAGWIIDGTGTPARRNVLLRVETGIITSLRSLRSSAAQSPELPVIDLSDCTLLPGLVDCHVHLTMSGTDDQIVRKTQLTHTFDQVLPLISERLKRHLTFGVMAVRDGGDSSAYALRYRDECLETMMLPIALKAAKAWRAKGRYGRMIARAPEPGRTLMDCIQREEQSPDHIKIINSGLNSITEFGKETSSQFSLDELTSAADAARSRRQKIMVHANGRLPVENALTARCDSIEHGFFMGRDNMQKMAELQITWIPTGFSMKAFSTLMPPESVEVQVAARNLEHQINQIETARTLGVPIAVGTDAGGYGLRHGASFSDELELFMAGGFTIEETIRCATFEGARLLGLHHELGRLAKGMPASFVAIGGPPSALPGALKHVKTVYIRGKRVI